MLLSCLLWCVCVVLCLGCRGSCKLLMWLLLLLALLWFIVLCLFWLFVACMPNWPDQTPTAHLTADTRFLYVHVRQNDVVLLWLCVVGVVVFVIVVEVCCCVVVGWLVGLIGHGLPLLLLTLSLLWLLLCDCYMCCCCWCCCCCWDSHASRRPPTA